MELLEFNGMKGLANMGRMSASLIYNLGLFGTLQYFYSGVFVGVHTRYAVDKINRIVDAINAHDKEAFTQEFRTPIAQYDYQSNISFGFPHGGAKGNGTWDEPGAAFDGVVKKLKSMGVVKVQIASYANAAGYYAGVPFILETETGNFLHKGILQVEFFEERHRMWFSKGSDLHVKSVDFHWEAGSGLE